MIRTVSILLVIVGLAGCSLPRGAALQTEILAQDKDSAPNFAIRHLTESSLPAIAAWPAMTGLQRNWLAHRHQDGTATFRAGDMVDLVVWDSDENSLITPPGQPSVNMMNLEIDESGQIFLPYFGAITIAGLTKEGARNRIQSIAEQTIPSAQIQLRSQIGPNRTVDMVSGVRNPGNFGVATSHFTTLNLISKAGGVAPNLRNPQVTLIRQGQRYGTSLKRLFENPEADVILKNGDKVLVQQDERYYRALGATNGDSLQYFENDTVTAMDALAQIGGLSETRADPKGILILREYPKAAVRADGGTGPAHHRVVFVVDLTTADGAFSAAKFELAPKDTILLTESPVNTAQTVIALMAAVVGLKP